MVEIEESIPVISSDHRSPANETYSPAQAKLERKLEQDFSREGVRLERAFRYGSAIKYALISSQREETDIHAHFCGYVRLR
jgi:hypothetical protein